MSSAATQKAIVVKELGKPVELVTDWPIPQPEPGQIQLKVSVAGINPHDEKAAGFGLFIAENLPAVLTNDVVGVVTKLGAGVTSVAVGDRVVSHAGFALTADFASSYERGSGPVVAARAGLAEASRQNGLQEYAVSDVGAFARIPDGISDDEAATLPTNVIAPLISLFQDLEIPAPWSTAAGGFDYAGATLLVVGGGSNCGRFAVQLARLAGIGRIVVVGGDEAELRGFGATHVVDRHGDRDAVLARVRDVVGDELVYAFDAVSPPEGQVLALGALSSARRGVLARLLPLGPVDESKVLGKAAGFEVRDTLGSSQVFPELARGFWERVPEFLETGKIKPLQYVVKEGLDPDHVNEVLAAYREGRRITKTHIHL